MAKCTLPGRHHVTEDRILSSAERNNVTFHVVEFIFLSNKMHILALDLIFPPVNPIFLDRSLSASAGVESSDRRSFVGFFQIGR